MRWPFDTLLDVSSKYAPDSNAYSPAHKLTGMATVIPNPSYDNNEYLNPEKYVCLDIHGYDHHGLTPEEGGFHVYSVTDGTLDTFKVIEQVDVGDLEDDF